MFNAGPYSVIIAERWSDGARRDALRGAPVRTGGWFRSTPAHDEPEALLAQAAREAGLVPFDGRDLPRAILQPRFVLARDIDRSTADRLVRLSRHAGMHATRGLAVGASQAVAGVGAGMFVLGVELDSPLPVLCGIGLVGWGAVSAWSAWRADHLPLAFARPGLAPTLAPLPVGADSADLPLDVLERRVRELKARVAAEAEVEALDRPPGRCGRDSDVGASAAR